MGHVNIVHNSVPKIETVMLSRGSMKLDGVYISGKIFQTSVLMTVDTGATRTLVSKGLFDKLHSEGLATLRDDGVPRRIVGADGNPLGFHGICDCTLELGPVTLTKPLLVADISDA